MKYGFLSSIVLLIITTSLLSACGSTTGGSPANVYSGSVFISDREIPGTNELFLVDSQATGVTKLSSPLAGNVKSFKVSPNIGFIAYLADQDIAGVDELYYIKQSVGVPDKVNAALSAGKNVTSYEWSPNGLYLAYIVDEGTAGDFELYVSDGRSVTMVSTASTGDNVIDYKWSPDSINIAFRTQLISTAKPELFVSKVDGSVIATQVSESPTGAGPTEYEWAPASVTSDSRLLAYMSDQDRAGIIDLYTTAIDNLASTMVTDTSTGSVQAFRWPNLISTHLAYTAELLSTPGHINLFTTEALNAAVVQVSDVGLNGNVTNDFLWAPNNSLLAYVADQETPGVFELFITTPAVAASSKKMSTTMVAGGGVDTTDGFIWGLFSNQLIYRADQDTVNVFELYTRTTDEISTTAGQKISGDVMANSIAVDEQFLLSPFGTIVSFVGETTTGVFELYGTTLTTNIGIVKLSADLDTTRRVFQHDWSSDGTKVFYMADQDADTINDAYTINLGDRVNLNLSADTINNASVTQGVFIDSFGVTELLFPL